MSKSTGGERTPTFRRSDRQDGCLYDVRAAAACSARGGLSTVADDVNAHLQSWRGALVSFLKKEQGMKESVRLVTCANFCVAQGEYRVSDSSMNSIWLSTLSEVAYREVYHSEVVDYLRLRIIVLCRIA